MHFFDCLPISLFLFLDNLEGAMLLTKYSVAALSFDSVNFQKVIGSPRALNVERDHALAVLTLDASALVFHATNNALQIKPFAVDLV